MNAEIESTPDVATEKARPTADELNALLLAGGMVQVSTYTRSTLYRQKHAGMFREGVGGNLYAQNGRRWDCLTCGGRLIVGLKTYKA